MFPFNLYPYSNFHNLNLDWILNRIKEMGAQLESFENHLPRFSDVNNAVWNDYTDYAPNEMVVYESVVYIAKRAVPAGVGLGDSVYWLKVVELNVDIPGLQAEIQKIQRNSYYVTPEDYGAAHDGVTNDAAAFEAALNSGYPVMLLRTNKRYLINTPVNVNNSAAKLVGAASWNEIDVGGNGAGINITGSGRIFVNNEYFVAENVYTYSYNMTGDEQAVYIINAADGLNGDAEFRGCIFSGGSAGIIANSRGLRVDRCLFARCTDAVILNYVGTVDAEDPITTSKVTGGRGFIFTNNRYHTGVIHSVRSLAGSSCWGLLYENNVSDHGGAGLLFEGAVSGATISGNIFDNALVPSLSSSGGLENVIFANNLCRSRNYTASGLTDDYFHVNGSAKNINISDCIFNGSGYRAIYFGTSPLLNVSITNCKFLNLNITGNNATYAPITLSPGNENTIITGNLFQNIGIIAMPCIRMLGSGYCRRTIIQNNLKVDNKDILVHAVMNSVMSDSDIQTYRASAS